MNQKFIKERRVVVLDLFKFSMFLGKVHVEKFEIIKDSRDNYTYKDRVWNRDIPKDKIGIPYEELGTVVYYSLTNSDYDMKIYVDAVIKSLELKNKTLKLQIENRNKIINSLKETRI